jgi:hypothetical protein
LRHEGRLRPPLLSREGRAPPIERPTRPTGAHRVAIVVRIGLPCRLECLPQPWRRDTVWERCRGYGDGAGENGSIKRRPPQRTTERWAARGEFRHGCLSDVRRVCRSCVRDRAGRGGSGSPGSTSG